MTSFILAAGMHSFNAVMLGWKADDILRSIRGRHGHLFDQVAP